MIAGKSNQAAVGSAPQKRSLFNKPSWSKPQALSNDTDLFHRSGQTYADLAAEAERARKRKLARKERERVRQNLTGERATKRRRTSEDEQDNDNSSSDGSSSYSSRKEFKSKSARFNNDSVPPSTSPQKPKHSPKSLTGRYETEVAESQKCQEQRQKPITLDIVDLEDEQIYLALPGQEPTCKSTVADPTAPTDNDQPVSDEEFPELARQARERARRKRLEEGTVSTTAKSQNDQLSVHQLVPQDPPPDPVLQILITSDIPNTVPLIVSRRLSQRLKDVRLAWVGRQNLTTSVIDTVFLTWRGKRVFDVTTCKSLGITVDATGRISLKEDLWEQEQEKIHMEAMTTKMLEAYKQSKRNAASGQEDDATQEATIVGQEHETQIRIILKAKGLDDLKLQVRPVRHLRVERLLCRLTSFSLLLFPRFSTLSVLSIRLV